MPLSYFLRVIPVSCFDQKMRRFLKKMQEATDHTNRKNRIHNLCIVQRLDYRWAAGVLCVSFCHRNLDIYRYDWLSIKFCENDSFRKLFLFLKKNFQYLGGISQDISVSRFDSRRSLSSANRRWSSSPILFVSFTQPCDQHDRKIRTTRKSAARWRGRRARGCRKLFFRSNLL